MTVGREESNPVTLNVHEDTAIADYFGMLLVKSLGPKRVSIIGISATGGFLHNVGQLLVASWIAQSWTVMLYLPVMSILGILAGIVIGIAGNYLLGHVRTLQKFQLDYESQRKSKKSSEGYPK